MNSRRHMFEHDGMRPPRKGMPGAAQTKEHQLVDGAYVSDGRR